MLRDQMRKGGGDMERLSAVKRIGLVAQRVEKFVEVFMNIVKYLWNTKDLFLVYGGNIERELRVSCYTDAGYLTDADDLRSQMGYVFIFNGGAVDWKSAKQSIFATSSTDAEYIASFDASKEAVWILKKLVAETSEAKASADKPKDERKNNGALIIERIGCLIVRKKMCLRLRKRRKLLNIVCLK
ncbi:hypothetical protein Tco_0194597 [Tanacetum coccineum]